MAKTRAPEADSECSPDNCASFGRSEKTACYALTGMALL